MIISGKMCDRDKGFEPTDYQCLKDQSRIYSPKMERRQLNDDVRENLCSRLSTTEGDSLRWEEFFGSSLDLAPSLMTIYDNYVESDNDTVDSNVRTVVVEHHHCEKNNRDHVTYPELMTSESINVAQEGSVTSSSVSEECDDGDPAELITGSSDAKKRPLSVSSTSSSSTSSLPRHQRKKVASMTSSPMSTTLSLGLQGPVAMECNLLSPSKDSGVTLDTVMQMDIASDDEDDRPASRGAEYAPDIINAKENNSELFSAKNNNVSAETGHGCTASELLPYQQQLNQSNDQINQLPYKDAKASDNNNEDSRRFYIDKVVAEILETERTYVRDLQEIIQGYQIPLEDSFLTGLDPEDLSALFGNITEIHAFNRLFLTELEKCDDDAVKVAQCFVNRNEGFVIYTDYCTNYPRAVEVLTECMREPASCEIFKEKQLMLRHSLPLGAYLLKPVQRILKYHLLLQNIVNNFDKDQSGYETITGALESMTSVAQHINEMKRKHEHAVRIQEIQSQLSDWDGADLTTYGELVLEDTFRMYGAKAERYFFLFEKCLLIAKKTEDGNLACKYCIESSNLMLVESIPKEPLSFHVIPWDNPKMQVTVQAKSLEHKRLWCQDIKRLILENYNAVIPDKAKELVMMLGKSKEEDNLDNVSKDPTPTRKQHTAPEYLERRRVRRKSATILPDFGLLKGKKGTRKTDGSPGRRHSPPQRRRSEAYIPSHKVNTPSPSKMLTKSKTETVAKASSGSRFGSFFRHRSRSLESIDLVQGKLDLPTNKKRNSRETDDENISNGSDSRPGSRCSDVDDRFYDNLEIAKGFEEQGSQKEKSPLRKSDSFRIATKLNRIDSKRVVDDAIRNRFKLRKGQRRRNRSSLESSEYGETFDSSRMIDDAYVSVKFTDTGFQMLDEGERCYNSNMISPTRRSAFSDSEENIRDYGELRSETDNQNDSERKRISSHIAGYNTDGVYTRRPTSAKDQRLSNLSEPLTRNKMVNNSYIGANISSSPAMETKAHHNHAVNGHRRLQKSNSFAGHNLRRRELIEEEQSTRDRIASDPTKSRNTNESVYDNYAAAIYSSLIGHDSRFERLSGSPISSPRKSAGNLLLRSSARPFTSHFTSHSRQSPIRDNPWVLQNHSNTPNTNLTSANKSSVLRRSNSLSSMCDSLEDMRCRKFRGQMKRSSDTLLFSNRNAFIATAVPRTIRQDIETEKIIARLGTPPREQGPSDFTDEVNICRERGKIISRYATPPRAIMEPPKSDQKEAEYMNLMSQSLQESCVDDAFVPGMSTSSSLDYSSRPSVMSRSFSTSSPAGTGQSDMWRDLEEYIKNSPDTPSLPKFPVFPGNRGCHSDIQRRSASLPRSETAMSARSSLSSGSSRLQSPLPSSPNSPFFSHGEGIVDSLKNAVYSITSRITKRSSRSVEASPVRSRSASALEDLRIRPPTPPPMPVSEKSEAESRKDKRNKFVYNLARQYSMRIKNTRPKNFSDKKTEKDTATLARQLAALLKENRQGGNVIGARMASSKPVVLGAYTLQRHKPLRHPGTDGDVDSDDNEVSGIITNESKDESLEILASMSFQKASPSFKRRHTDIKVENHDSGCPDLGNSNLPLADRAASPEAIAFPQKEGATMDTSPDSPTLSPVPSDAQDAIDSSDENSSLYFYERKFLDDLESNFGDEDDVFRDSAVYSDDGTLCGDPDAMGLKISIRDTVRLIEQRYRARPVQKIEIKRKEKGHAIKEIMKCLESNTSFVKEGPEGGAMSDILTEKPTSPTSKERELVECATLTRIRQNSLRIGDNTEVSRSGNEIDEEKCPTDSSDLSPAKKGWVKEVVDLLEHDQLT